MPRNRADVARDEKVDEIVEAARRRLIEGGYDQLSVAAVARDLGLAQAAIYWYFPTKDHLLVAAMDGIFRDILAAKPRKKSAMAHVLWFTERLDELKDLRMVMRERGRHSEVAADFNRSMGSVLRQMLVNALRANTSVGSPEDVADVLMALCDGVLIQPISRSRKRELIRFGVLQLAPELSDGSD